MASLRTRFIWKTLLTLAAVGAGLCLRAWAQEEKQQPPELSQDTQDVINEKIRPASEAKQWDKVITEIDAILAKVSGESYDAALMYKLKAQGFLNLPKADYPGALDALKRSLAISDRHHFFNTKDTLETVYYIAQLSYQEGATSKDSKKQLAFFDDAEAALERWLKGIDPHAITQDNIQFLATLYFTLGQGIEINGVQKADPAKLQTALTWIDKGLRAAIHPRDVFYQLKIAALFQLNRMEEGYQFLESRLKAKPDSKSYWQQLAATYLQLADAAEKKKDNQNYFTYTVRAILTMERAQKLGFLNTPKDNYQIVGMYFNINQFDRACELLDAGLRNGQIESTEQNWQLLAYSYQQLHKDKQAIQTLVDATKVFPKTGQLEYQIAQTYFGINDEKSAFEHIKACIAHGGTEKPQVAWLFYAYLGLDLKKYDEALKAAHEAEKYPEAEKEAKKMADAITAQMQDEANRKSAL